MTKRVRAESGAVNQRAPESRQEVTARRQRVLTKGRASITESITGALVVKDGDIFFLSAQDGDVPLEGVHGLGLYYHDCRYLNGYELRLAGRKLDVLAADDSRGFMAVHQLTNNDIQTPDGNLVQKEEVSLRWERIIDSEHLALDDVLTIQSYSLQAISLPLTLSFDTAFEDMFDVRGLFTDRPGEMWNPTWDDRMLRFRYDGADGLYRWLSVRFSPSPDRTVDSSAHFDITLSPKGTFKLHVSLIVSESPDASSGKQDVNRKINIDASRGSLSASMDEWLGRHTGVATNSPLLDQIIRRSLLDLRMLKSELRGREFFAAGVPWFVTLFGRDSLITALQTLAYEPNVAEQILRLLASLQGQRVDRYTDEEPGRILHEMRFGELARLHEIPHSPYYGTIDATPLFLILIARHAAWTGDLSVFNDLRSNVELALSWINDYGDTNGDGYVDYRSSSDKGLVNQGWKDSGDGIINAEGHLAKPPIALVEVQGYVYRAKQAIADLYERAGNGERAKHLRHEAAELRKRFNRDFWLEDKDFFALALQEGLEPAAVISSNPGHALWSGIVDDDKAWKTADRLMANDMFSGWGVRTLSTQEHGYNPIGYHLGTVWPHDNAIIAAGFRRYGASDAFQRLFAGIFDAASCFHNDRLPEVFGGFEKSDFSMPVRYPVACHPQAWAAGSVPFMLETALGLTPEALDKRLRIVRPLLPDGVDCLEMRRLRVGGAVVNLRFERQSSGQVAVQVLGTDGELDVVVENDK